MRYGRWNTQEDNTISEKSERGGIGYGKGHARRTDAGVGHRLAVVREALEAAEEERARAL